MSYGALRSAGADALRSRQLRWRRCRLRPGAGHRQRRSRSRGSTSPAPASAAIRPTIPTATARRPTPAPPRSTAICAPTRRPRAPSRWRLPAAASPSARSGCPPSAPTAPAWRSPKSPACAANTTSSSPSTASASCRMMCEADSAVPQICIKFSDKLAGHAAGPCRFRHRRGRRRPRRRAAGEPDLHQRRQARRALHRPRARRAARRRWRDPRPSGRAQRLRPRPRAVGRLRRQRLRAAGRRRRLDPAHLGQHRHRQGDHLPHRRPRHRRRPCATAASSASSRYYSADQIADETGEKVWEGEIGITSKLNETVVTAIPIAEAVQDDEARRLRHHGRAGHRQPGRMGADRHPVVHRLRSRPDRAFRPRRHPRHRALARRPPSPSPASRCAWSPSTTKSSAKASPTMPAMPTSNRAWRAAPAAWRRNSSSPRPAATTPSST